jgi:hypothetical protein
MERSLKDIFDVPIKFGLGNTLVAQRTAESIYKNLLRLQVQKHFKLEIQVTTNVELDLWIIEAIVRNEDGSLHGRVSGVTHDLSQFPTPTFTTQVMMLAG